MLNSELELARCSLSKRGKALSLYTPEKAKEDFAVELILARAGIMTVKRLVNCAKLPANGLQVIVSPLHIVRGVSSTCRVVAVEK